MLFIGGVQPRTVVLEKRPEACPACSHNMLRLKRIDQYVSLFFIPIFPVKRGVPFLTCDNCNTLDVNTFGEAGRAAGSQENCSRCGKSVADDFLYCPYCGQNL